MPCANLLLDLDGTLTDPFPGITRCIAFALRELDLPVPDDAALCQWIGPPLKQSFERYFKLQGGGDAERAVSLYRERFSRVGLFENSVYEGIPDLLQTLDKNSVQLILATSKPLVYARRIIRHFGFDSWFKALYGSELDGQRTDKTQLLRYILEQERISACDCIMVGDREFDMFAAQAHGMGAIGALWGYGSSVELLQAGADMLASSPAELGKLLIDKRVK
jgi:phosphoglycolate phosphatase